MLAISEEKPCLGNQDGYGSSGFRVWPDMTT